MGIADDVLKEIGTNLWRLKNKMCPPGRSEPPDELASMYRHVDSMWEALREAGVQIQDHTGKAFDSGMPIVCLAFQPTPGLKREIIVETIKPSIFLNNQRIQTGEVIVGAPIAIASEPEALAKEPLANASGSDGDAKDAPSLAASEPEALAKDVPTLANASGSESHGEPKP
ncbi:MAG: hypothetical protein HYR84_00455 [Planctomycetes bacterium]|nr:hypothetical protein [Planctomycetota bacterium]